MNKGRVNRLYNQIGAEEVSLIDVLNKAYADARGLPVPAHVPEHMTVSLLNHSNVDTKRRTE